MVGYRHCCWTLNNYTPEEQARIDDPHPKTRYLVYGKEIGEKEGTPHLQGYAEFTDQLSMTAIKNILSDRIHMAPRGGKPKAAAGYCKKGTDPKLPDNSVYFPRTLDDPGTWVGNEYGEISQQGKRTDISAPTEMLTEDGASLRDVARTYPEQWVKYNRGFRDLRYTLLTPRCLDAPPEVIVLWGPTETGKTRDAILKYFPDEKHYVYRSSNGNWFDQYDGEKKIILDEFRGGMPWPDLLALLDRNEYLAPVKGSYVHVQADKFILTSPMPPWMWYTDLTSHDRYAQLARRITKVVRYFGPGELAFDPE